MSMRAISWFSGIGGFDLALKRAGHEIVGACEIDRFARRVYAARLGAPAWFPEDIRDAEAASIPEADFWCGGFPCQDVSIAGRRRGISGARSGLIWRLLALASERRPAYLLLENVPGLLSGADGDLDGDDVGEPANGPVSWFGALLEALVESGFPDVAWRVLDARWFVPQRRARVFILARRAGAGGRHPAEVLLEPARVRGNPPASGEAREDLAGCLEARARGGHFFSADEAAAGHLIPFDRAQVTSRVDRSACRPGDPAPTLHGEAPLLAVDAAGFNAFAESGSGGNGYEVGVSPPIRGSNPPATTVGVRRLTPTECERLQGFQDGWTCLCGCAPYSMCACACPDGPRYRTLGNAVCVPVAEWIVRRLP